MTCVNHPEQSGQQTSQGFLTKPILALMLVLGFICIFYGLSDYRVFGTHEIHIAAPVRQMVASGNYVVPYEAGHPRLRKPPLAYWTTVASVKFFDQINTWTVRFPAAFSGLLLSALMGYWAYRWYGKSAGYLTAFVQATSYYTMLWSRRAEMDMMLTLINVSALYLVATQPRGQTWRQGFPRGLLIFTLLGLSTLTKFHYGPALILAVIGLYWLVEKRYRDFLHALNPIGWILWLGPCAWWVWAVATKLPEAWEIWEYELVDRATGEMGYTTIWFYFRGIFWVTLPWTPIWILELGNSWRKAWREGDSQERFLWIWLLAPLAIVTLQPDKHTNYMLTFLPPLSLMAGRYLTRALTADRWLSFQWNRTWALRLTAVNVLMGIAAYFVVRKEWPESELPATYLFLLCTLGLNGIVWTFHVQSQKTGVVLSAICFTSFVAIFFGELQQIRDPWRVHVAFAKQVANEVGEERILGYHLTLPAAYQLGPHYMGAGRTETAKKKFAQEILREKSVLIMTTEHRTDALKKLGQLTPLYRVEDDLKRLWDGRKRLPVCYRLETYPQLSSAELFLDSELE